MNKMKTLYNIQDDDDDSSDTTVEEEEENVNDNGRGSTDGKRASVTTRPLKRKRVKKMQYKSSEFVNDTDSSDDDSPNNVPIAKRVPPLARKTIKMGNKDDTKSNRSSSGSSNSSDDDKQNKDNIVSTKRSEKNNTSSSSSSSSNNSSSDDSDSSSTDSDNGDAKIDKVDGNKDTSSNSSDGESDKDSKTPIGTGKPMSTNEPKPRAPATKMTDKSVRTLQESTRYNIIDDNTRTVRVGDKNFKETNIDNDENFENFLNVGVDTLVRDREDDEDDENNDPDYRVYKENGQSFQADDVEPITMKTRNKSIAARDMEFSTYGELNNYMTRKHYLNVCCIVDEDKADIDVSKTQVAPCTDAENAKRAKFEASLKRNLKPYKLFSDNNIKIRKYIDTSIQPTMRVSDYEKVVDPSIEDYVSLYTILSDFEKNHKMELKIVPSRLGTLLKDISNCPEKLPQETMTLVNFKTELRHYKLMYGFIPARYSIAMDIFIMNMIKARTNEPYDLFEGEIELMSMALWRTTANDLKTYNERCGREPKKTILRYLYLRILDTLRHVRDTKLQYFTNTEKNLYVSACRFLKMFKRYAVFDNKNKIQAMVLVIVKELLLLVYSWLTQEEMNLWAGLFSNFKIHHVLFPHTYNYLIQHRPNIFTWFGQIYSIYSDTLDSRVLQSVWRYDPLKTKNVGDVVTNNLTVFTKKDVRVMFYKIFPKDKDVPLSLLIKIDNFFMIFVHYFIHYLKTTGMVEQRSVGLKHIICFLQIFHPNVWPRYGNPLLDVRVRSTIKKEFANCIKTERDRMGDFDNDTFVIENEVIDTLLLFAFNVLSWVLGPILISTQHVASPHTYALLFIRAIEIFERDYLGSTDNFPFPYNFPKWLTNGHADDDYTEENAENFDTYENGVLMFPDMDVYDSCSDDDEAEYYRNVKIRRLAGENRNVVDLGIPDNEDSDFNDSDSECEVYDTTDDVVYKMRLLNKVSKVRESLALIESQIHDGHGDSDLLENKKKYQDQREKLETALLQVTEQITNKDILGKNKKVRLNCERAIITGECDERLFDMGIVPPDVEKYLNRPVFDEYRNCRKRPVPNVLTAKSNKRVKRSIELKDDDNNTIATVDYETNDDGDDENLDNNTGKKVTSVVDGNIRRKKRGINKIDYLKFTLSDDSDFKIVDGVKMFGLISNKILNRGKRSKVGCSLCAVPISGSYNMKINASCIVSVCLVCTHKIYNMLSTPSDNGVTFETLQDFIATRVECRYKAPLLFDSDGIMLTEMLPKMNGPEDMYKYTYNKVNPQYGKRIQVKEAFQSLCDKYNWTGYAKKVPKRRTPKQQRKI